MDRTKIITRLGEGKPAIVPSTPFSISQLRSMARAAMRGSTTLTIIIDPSHGLCDTDIDNITDEAPANVVIDYSRLPL
jgi:hypothetical protein